MKSSIILAAIWSLNAAAFSSISISAEGADKPAADSFVATGIMLPEGEASSLPTVFLPEVVVRPRQNDSVQMPSFELPEAVVIGVSKPKA